jgi:hypothetical protein
MKLTNIPMKTKNLQNKLEEIENSLAWKDMQNNRMNFKINMDDILHKKEK